MSYPRPNLEQLIDRAVADLETRLPGTNARLLRSNLNALARTHAAATHGLYGYIQWLTRQLFADTAEVEYLDRLASIWDVSRKAAAKAEGKVTFTGNDGGVIPAGTLLARSDDVEFSTDAEVTIAGGDAVADVTASEGGEDGNTAAGTSLSLVNPVSGVDSNAEVTTAIANGTDTEADDDLRDRLLARIQQPPHGGADFDYVGWALEVAGVTRAWVYPLELGLGTVTVRFVVDDDPDGIIPDSQQVQDVQDYIDERRPVTADVTVVAPEAVPLDFEISDLDPAEQSVRDAIEASLKDLLRRESEPAGTILISHIREAISIAAGEHDHVLVSPSADVTHETNEIPTMGTITWS